MAYQRVLQCFPPLTLSNDCDKISYEIKSQILHNLIPLRQLCHPSNIDLATGLVCLKNSKKLTETLRYLTTTIVMEPLLAHGAAAQETTEDRTTATYTDISEGRKPSVWFLSE